MFLCRINQCEVKVAQISGLLLLWHYHFTEKLPHVHAFPLFSFAFTFFLIFCGKYLILGLLLLPPHPLLYTLQSQHNLFHTALKLWKLSWWYCLRRVSWWWWWQFHDDQASGWRYKGTDQWFDLMPLWVHTLLLITLMMIITYHHCYYDETEEDNLMMPKSMGWSTSNLMLHWFSALPILM